MILAGSAPSASLTPIFAGALSDDVRRHAIDANHAKEQRDAGGDGEQDHRKRHLRRGAIDEFLQRAHLRERQIGIDLLQRGPRSAGANSAESAGVQSRADWLTKQFVALKEMRETYFWLRLIRHSAPPFDGQPELLDEPINSLQF